MAVNHVLACAVPIVHSVAQTHFEGFAILADACARPVSVAKWLKTPVPNLIKIVGVDAALCKAVAVDVGAGGGHWCRIEKSAQISVICVICARKQCHSRLKKSAILHQIIINPDGVDDRLF